MKVADNKKQSLPTDSKARKDIPLARGVLDYFPAALAAVAELSRKGNEKHNAGEPMHHARGKSTDHADCLLRHLVDRGKIDPETGLSHSVSIAWRALALLQEELEAAGAPLARGARLPTEDKMSVLPDKDTQKVPLPALPRCRKPGCQSNAALTATDGRLYDCFGIVP